MDPEYKQVEITVKFLADEYKHNHEAYVQRINFDWYFNKHPMLIQEIVAVVNGLKLPAPINYKPVRTEDPLDAAQ